MRRLLPAILTGLISVSIFGQERPAYQAVRAATPPVIDGDLGDAVWQEAPETTGFTDIYDDSSWDAVWELVADVKLQGGRKEG